MLLNLHVENLALIGKADVDFEKGLMVITGETGAGKSLILGSVNAAIGGRISKDQIRTGEKEALVEMTFLAPDETIAKLQDNDIYTDGNTVTITRKISEQKSVTRVNGETVSVKLLKELMEGLVDVHGQHDHQSLLKSENHLKIVDDYAQREITQVKDKVSALYNSYKSLLKEYRDDEMSPEERAKEIDFIDYEINEIESANLKEDEDVLTEERLKQVAGGYESLQKLSSIRNYLGGYSSSASDLISRAAAEAASLKGSDGCDNLRESVLELESLIFDVIKNVDDLSKELDVSEEELSMLEKRNDEINHLKLKYGKSIKEIFDYKLQREERRDYLISYEKTKEEQKQKLTSLRSELEVQCEVLSGIRQKAAKSLAKEISQELKDLSFINNEFDIIISNAGSISQNGKDKAEFVMSANVGEPLRELKSVASGGELSRIMLAIRSAMAKTDSIGTLIFDEIDSGISGITAENVAKKLYLISKNHQVILITHLAQIAVMGDNHYLIEKKVADNRTFTDIHMLDEEGRENEIIRISSGAFNDAIAKEHAKALLAAAKDFKKCCDN